MQRILLLAALICAVALPAQAADKPSLNIKTEVPYREDSGLTKAEYFLAKEKYAEALDEAEAVLKRHPKSADAYTYRGLAFDRLGDSKKAAENFKKALLLNPEHLGANKYLADVYLADGDLSLALEQMQVIRMACANSGCPELADVQRGINELKKKDKMKEEEKEE